MQGLEVTLRPDKYRAVIGEPVSFDIAIRNAGTQPIAIPADPDLLLTWVYPDGRRDNLIQAERSKSEQEWLVLKPGQQHVAHSVVTTYYFDRTGIHEFRAIVSAGASTPAKHQQLTWTGRAISNGFGVQFDVP